MNKLEVLEGSEEKVSAMSGIFSFFVSLKDAVNNFFERFSPEEIASGLSVRYNRFHHSVLNEFGSYGLYILILFVIFLVLIALIYAHSVLETFRLSKNLANENQDSSDGMFYQTAEQNNEQWAIEDMQITEVEENEIEEEIYEVEEEQVDAPITTEEALSDEQPLPKRLMAQMEKDEELSQAVIAASSPAIDEKTHLSNEYMRLKNIMKQHANDEKLHLKQLKTKNDNLEEDILKALRIEENKNISNLITLVLNLLGRSVTEQKIIQIIYQKYTQMFDEENIFQIVRGICDFIGLCNSGRLDFMPDRANLPQNEQALYALSRGDTTPCLMLLQSFLNMEMEKAEQENGVIQEITYAQAANCSCIMGNLAYLDDKSLAHNAFELATELSPTNVNAWNRLADMYIEEDMVEKAMIAYQSVLKYSDEIMYPEQIANAQNKLAEYYEKQGMNQRAEEYRQNSLNFYKIYGLYSKLTQTEEDVLALITETSSVEEAIRLLLPRVEISYTL